MGSERELGPRFAALASPDRKTVRRYTQGRSGPPPALTREGGEVQLTDELIGAVMEGSAQIGYHGRGGSLRESPRFTTAEPYVGRRSRGPTQTPGDS